MKKKLFTSAFVLNFLGFTIQAQTNVLHLNLGSHNEMSDISYGVNYNTNYTTIKNKAFEVADSVNANGAKWNMQVESNFILSCIQFDSAPTNSNNLMKKMDNLSYVEVDPHNHLDTVITNSTYNPYNYSDLNHLLDSCGLTTRTNVGGFIYKANDWVNTDGNWTLWKNGLMGRTFPWATWTPTVLWGGGTLNHVNDPNQIGIWHPGGATIGSFLTNNPSQLLDIGNGCTWLIKDTTNVATLLTSINSFVTAINTTAPASNTFYTATIMFDFRYILNSGYTDKIAEVLRGIKPLVANGSVAWETLSEKRTDWLSSHNNTTDNFIKDCSNVSVGINESNSFENTFDIYPNPTSNVLSINTSNATSPIEFTIYNFQGIKIKTIKQTVGTSSISINISDLSSGMYFISTNISGSTLTKKIIKE